jgi:glutathione synthase/RimK-type ligase-like ATP-grasp enzyme
MRTAEPTRVLLCWEAAETNSWNPVLAGRLRAGGLEVTEVHDLDQLRALDLATFDVCLPRFRACAAHMGCLDEVLVESGLPMVNSRSTRRRCEDKGLAHFAFERLEIPQPPSFVLSAEGIADRAAQWSGETLLKPLSGSRGDGIEILPSLEAALERGIEREEDLLVQLMIWPARSWRVIVGRSCGIVDPYWRRPARSDDRVLSISTGAHIVRDPLSQSASRIAERMLEAVDGDLLAVDLLEADGRTYALEINHNFDAHGGSRPAVDAFRSEISAIDREPLSTRFAGRPALPPKHAEVIP